MHDDRNQAREPKQQVLQKHPDEWQPDLNPNPLAGQNIGPPSDPAIHCSQTAFHLRKAGLPLPNVDDEDLTQVSGRLEPATPYQRVERRQDHFRRVVHGSIDDRR